MTVLSKIVKPVVIVIAICLLIPLVTPVSNAAYTPPFTVLKIGLAFDSSVIPSANLQNVSGMGNGFNFGYFDSNRNFVPIGAWTDETRISVLMDRNVSWQPNSGGGAGEYQEGVDGSVVVGCFHILLSAKYDTFAEAKSAADSMSDAFVRYESERFRVLVGQFTSRASAEREMDSMSISGTAIDSGTQQTLTIVRTGTNKILFEYDMGTTQYLGIMPRPSGGENPETLSRGYRYTGGFQFARLEGLQLTVINYVSVEDYVKGVVPYEMSNSWPLEALKAQACCARTYAFASLNRHGVGKFDLCTEQHCQVYRGRERANASTDRAVEETAGMYVTYEGELTQTFYAASNGGASESVENVWTQAFPYLRGVIDPYEALVADRIANYYWTITYTPAQITARLRERGYDCSTIVSMVVSQFSPTGNVISVTMTDSNGRKFVFSKRAQLATALGVPLQRFTIGNQGWMPGNIFANDPALNIGSQPQYFAVNGDGEIIAIPGDSLNAIIGSGDVVTVEGEDGSGFTEGDTNLIGGVFTIRGAGRGHSVGMSQWGAYAMAFYHDKTYVDIIKFYYTGVEITQVNR